MASSSLVGSVPVVETVLFVLLVAAFVAIVFGCVHVVRLLLADG